MDEQVQESVDQPTPEQVGTHKWLPFGFTWKTAWKWSAIVMPILCVLSFLGIGFGVYVGFSGIQLHPLIAATWLLINIALWLVVVVHTVVDMLVVREWKNGSWAEAMNNGYIMFLIIINAISLLFGGGFLSSPSVYGVSSFCLLVSLGILTFMDIWVLNHMKEKEAAKATP